MNAIAAYMANKTREGDNSRNEYRESDGREHDRRSEYDGAESRVYSQRQPDQYPARSVMGEHQPEGNEMRRRRDSRGRYMMDEPISPESRYRGRDGRWKAGTRRSEYDGSAYDNYPIERRMGDDDDEEKEKKKYDIAVEPKNVIQWPYAPHEPPDSQMNPRQIGFGAMNHMGEPRDGEHMEHGAYKMEELAEFDRETAEEWVRNMHNEDKNHPRGGKWSAEALKPMAQKYSIPTEGKRFWEFYAMVNAMYSDYSEVAKKFGITSPEFYVCLAKAFMNDKDAEDDKVALYYEYIAKK